MPFDATSARRDFPLLRQADAPVYFDNAATTQKPDRVLDAERDFYCRSNANAHRASHQLARSATAAYEAARHTVAGFLGARANEIVFTRGTTEALNLLAAALAPTVQPGDVLLVSALEHHSNLLPWRRLAQQRGAHLQVLPVREDGSLDWSVSDRLPARLRGLAVAQVSNVTGEHLPIRQLVQAAQAQGAWTVVDGAQAVAHLPVDLAQLGCDFYAFSGHKVYGPLGIGVLWGRQEALAALPPWQLGGGMVEWVDRNGAGWQSPPQRFEAGTPNLAGAIGLAAALQYLQHCGNAAVFAHQQQLLLTLERAFQQRGLRVLGPPLQHHGLLSLAPADIHPQDLGVLLDQAGIAVRVGHHCAMPLMQDLGLPGTVRVAVGLYNTLQDVDALLHALDTALDLLR